MKISLSSGILFISHEASLSGAPILLLNLIRLLKSKGLTNLHVVLIKGGELENEFRELSKVHILKKNNYGKGFLVRRVFDYIFLRLRILYHSKKYHSFPIIFNNTITNGRILKLIIGRSQSVFSYIHELYEVASLYQKNNDVQLTIKYTNHFFYPSIAVSQMLLERFHIDYYKMSRLNYYFPKLFSDEYKFNKKEALLKFRNKYNVISGKFFVVGMGSATKRKGFDLFIDTCLLTIQQNKEVCFVWVGDFIDTDFKEVQMRRINNLDLENYLIVTGNLPWSIENLMPFDLFLLSSREDPYPLVVLEAGIAGLPVIGFSGSGGIEELISQENGWILPMGDTISVSNLILTLANDTKDLLGKGNSFRLKVQEMHQNPDLIIDQIEYYLK